MAPGDSKLLLSDIVSHSDKVPSKYIRPTSDRPDLSNVVNSSLNSIPIIDLEGLGGSDHQNIINAIRSACTNDGFFMIINHGIPKAVIEGMLSVGREFFHLPQSERMKMYSDDPTKANRLSTSFNVRTENVSNWRDFLRLHCYPLEKFIHEWPANPSDFRKVVGEYSRHARELALRLLEAISESLGLDKQHMVKAMGKHAQHMAINYYPPCPQPELTYGLPGHKDPNAITILLQDGVSGLQLMRDGKWVAVNPVEDAFIINIGDQMQALSNDRYKSVLHRVIVNNKSERISIPTFYSPSPDAIIEPAKGLLDEDHPPVYRTFTYEEYFTTFWNKGLKSASCLDLFKQDQLFEIHETESHLNNNNN
ncbi:2-oxoglutarate (2OG) and Fe(II)-dependent oxygenase superfamily protein [Rhynchospora pubera]|uniref:2-oxoglutarate (2OG) and Fe(II)-dependent oxygenase superfamily protein n=1 Tax=Rhynchospora pubera TaxID=906938 RepID=A0AAV8BXF3_9POAL|nr:2-oxoglutarate (2OG) and Fe(II)-dependent oxygenase superfamily protein [Rhynchospora pubera]